MYIRCIWLFVMLMISWLTRSSCFTKLSRNLLSDLQTKSCPGDGIPVCGIRDEQVVLFPNVCLFKSANKDIRPGETSFKKIPLQYCMHGCQFSCPETYKPVCSRSIRSKRMHLFKNQCELTKYLCNTNKDYIKISVYECLPKIQQKKLNKFLEKRSESPKTVRQPVPCTNVFKPVCGSYMGVKSSFKNECLLNAENVAFNRDWRIIKNDMCPEDYEKTRRRKEKPNKAHSIKKRSYQYPTEYNANVNNQNELNVPPNNLFVYVPPTFHNGFINPDSFSNEHPIPQNKIYNEFLESILTFTPTEKYEIDDSISDESVISPLPFDINRPNFNYVSQQNLAHEINRQKVYPDIEPINDESNEQVYYAFKKDNTNFEKGIKEITTSTYTSTETTQMAEVTVATTHIPEVANREIQLKNENASKQKIECKFGSAAICATLEDGTLRTFDTVCDMMTANVYFKNTWTRLHAGSCENCKYNCPREYQPLCVSKNGVNYTMINECYYNMGICMDKKSKWEKLSNKECERRKSRIPERKPGFPYTSDYFSTKTTELPSADSLSHALSGESMTIKSRKSKKRSRIIKRSISLPNSHEYCSGSHYNNQYSKDSLKCKCWDDTMPAQTSRIVYNAFN